jgi:starch phosphorylase
VKVELYTDGVNGSGPVRHEMTRGQESVGVENGYVYSAQVPAARGATDQTPRVIPHRSGVAISTEGDQMVITLHPI